MSTEQGKPYITTVAGPISPEQFGFCHSHEHLFIQDGESAKVNAALRIDEYPKTLAEVEMFREIGGNSIVDAQPVGCGRMGELLLQVSSQTGVNIIASTGFHKLVFYPDSHWIHHIDEYQLATIFIQELTEGMYIDADTGLPNLRMSARPGVIKTASDVQGIDQNYVRLFRAAAAASLHTGTPIMSHTEGGLGALEQIRVYENAGIEAERLILCHVDKQSNDLSYIREVASAGVYLELDTIARYKYHTDEEEADLICKLVDDGYEDQILLGLDSTRERLKSYGGNVGLVYLLETFIPMLRARGLKEGVIGKFVRTNPARAFTNRLFLDNAKGVGHSGI